MLIIGVGELPCKVINRLQENYSNSGVPFKFVKIGVGSKYDYNLPLLEDMEEYEEHVVKNRFFVKEEPDDKKIVVVLDGAEKLNGIILFMLDRFKQHEIDIIYIKPDLDFLDDPSITNNTISNQVLQQYARSGVFNQFLMIDSERVSELVSESSLSEYEARFVSLLAELVYRYKWFKNMKPVYGKLHKYKEINRIGTLGILNTDDFRQNMLYDLKFIKECQYYFALDEDRANTDVKFLKKVKMFVKEVAKGEDVKCSFGIYPTKYKSEFYYCQFMTNIVQESKLQKDMEKVI